MSTDTGRERIDGGRRRRTVVQLTPGAQPGQAGELLVSSPSQESADQSKPRERNEPSGPREGTKEGAQGMSLFPVWLRRLREYGLALLFVAASALVRWALGEVLSPAPFLVFYLAWVVAAAFGGLGPVLLAAITSWLCVDLFFDSTPWHVGFGATASAGRFVVFMAGGMAVGIIGEKTRRARIHERRQTEELAGANAALGESERRLSLAQQIAHVGTFDWDIRTGVNIWTPELEAMYGLPPGGFAKTEAAWEQLVHPQDRAEALHLVARAFEAGEPTEGEWRVVWPDGSVHWLAGRWQVFKDESGKPLRMTGVNIDITERKRAEEALTASERKYRSLVHNIPDVTWTTDREGRTRFISPNVKDVYGYSAEEIYAGDDIWLGNVHPDDRPRLEKVFGELFTQKKPYDVEYRIRRKDGNWIWLHDRSVSTYEKEGQWYADGVFSDVTERKRMEEEIQRHTEHLEELVEARTHEVQESERRYRSLAENAPDIIQRLDRELRHLYVNPAFERATGLSPHAVIGKTDRELGLPQDLIPFWEQAAQMVLRTGESQIIAFEMPTPQGRRHYEARLVPEFTPDGSTGYVLAITRDITEREQAEQELRESRNRYQALIETTADFIWEMDTSGKYTYCSPQMKGLWGYEPQDMIGKTPFDVMPPQDREQAIESFMSLAKSPRPFTGLEASSYDSQGRLITVEISGVPFFDADGQLLGYRGISRDVTERKRAQEALAESRKKYRGLVEKVNDWVWEIDADGVYTYASPRAGPAGLLARGNRGKDALRLHAARGSPAGLERLPTYLAREEASGADREHPGPKGRPLSHRRDQRDAGVRGRRGLPGVFGHRPRRDRAQGGRGSAAGERGAVPQDL